MSFLSAATLKELITQESLIAPFDKDRIAFIEGSKYDLTVAKVFRQRMLGKVPVIGRNHRNLPAADELDVMSPTVTGPGWYRLWPWFPYLVQSREIISVPREYLGIVFCRTSIFRGAARLIGTVIDPGYSGVITAGIDVRHWRGLWLEQEARFAAVIFAEFDSILTDPYRGVWGAKRLTTDGKDERGF